MYAGKMGKTVSVKKYKNREKQTMKKTTEFTPTAFILGILLAVVFGGANSGSRDLDGDCAAVVKAGFDSGK